VVANNLNQSTAALTNSMLWAAKPSVYSAQIFADFAAYSLIAIGLGRLFGYELPINFRRPYFCRFVYDFLEKPAHFVVELAA
jgi:alginate O-acetyltransferase complex protein AlgI